MKKTRISGTLALTTCALVACAALVTQAAQTPAPAQSSASLSKTADTVTIEGCVERSPATSSSTPGAVGTSGMANSTFILSDAMKSPTDTSASKAAIASSYRLDAPDSKLTAHVGHKVEITGTIEAQDATAPPASSSSASAASAPKLKVDNVKMLASTCTP